VWRGYCSIIDTLIKRRIVTVVSDGELSILKSGGSYYMTTNLCTDGVPWELKKKIISSVIEKRPSAVGVNVSFSEVLFVIPHSLEIIHPETYWVFRG